MADPIKVSGRNARFRSKFDYTGNQAGNANNFSTHINEKQKIVSEVHYEIGLTRRK